MAFWIPSHNLAEINGSRSEQYSGDSNQATVQLVGEWDSRYDIENELRGVLYPWNSNLACSSVQMQPYLSEEFVDGTDEEAYNYTKCLFTVTFTDEGNEQEEEGDDGEGNTVSFTESIEPNFEMRELDYHAFKWSDGTAMKEKEAPSQLVPSLTITRTYSGLENLPSWFYTLLGCCNENTWRDNYLGIDFDPETLLFATSTASRSIEYTKSGSDEEIKDEKWSITFKMIYRDGGWNKFVKPGNSEPQSIRYANNDQDYKIYTPQEWRFS